MTGDSCEVNPESWTQLKGSLQLTLTLMTSLTLGKVNEFPLLFTQSESSLSAVDFQFFAKLYVISFDVRCKKEEFFDGRG